MCCGWCCLEALGRRKGRWRGKRPQCHILPQCERPAARLASSARHRVRPACHSLEPRIRGLQWRVGAERAEREAKTGLQLLVASLHFTCGGSWFISPSCLHALHLNIALLVLGTIGQRRNVSSLSLETFQNGEPSTHSRHPLDELSRAPARSMPGNQQHNTQPSHEDSASGVSQWLAQQMLVAHGRRLVQRSQLSTAHEGSQMDVPMLEIAR
jgi:hypothetical protein